MANIRRDPTGNSAAGSVDKEIARRKEEIKRAAALLLSGKLSKQEEMDLMRNFTGIFRGMLSREMQRQLAGEPEPEPRPSRGRRK